MSEHALHTTEQTPPVRLVAPPPQSPAVRDERVHGLVESYRRLADVFHDVLAEQSLDRLLERIADALADLIPHDTLTIFEADEGMRLLRPVLVRDQWADEIMQAVARFGEGVTGWAVERRQPALVLEAHRDPRVKVVPGTPHDEPEALISIPLIARDQVKGALNVYRLGERASFSDDEFEPAKRFGDAAALALDNAEIRARLEHQAQTDSLTGLFNHRYFHERLHAELQGPSRSGDSVGVLMLDIDDFKRVNDVHGHAVGDEILCELARTLRGVVRTGDAVCRLGGEEFAVIISCCGRVGARTLATRLTELLTRVEFGPAGPVTVSIGLALGPEHAMNARELAACAEGAMMTAKARGKNQIVFFDEASGEERPDTARADVRSLAHMKMLQRVSGKLNRLTGVGEIGSVVASELRALIDYYNCRVFLVEGDECVPIAFLGQFPSGVRTTKNVPSYKVGEGITGRVAATGRTLLLGDAASCDFAVRVPGTDGIQESLLAVPLSYGSRTTGVIVISKLGRDQLDDDDARLVEVLAGPAAVALENARLYEAQRRDAETATALLQFSRELAAAAGLEETLARIVHLSASILGSPRTSVWLQGAASGDLVAEAEWGDDGSTPRVGSARYPAALADRLAAVAEPFFLGPKDLAQIEGVPAKERGFAVAPLALDDGRRGCIAAEAAEREFSERDLRLLAGLAHQAQLAITNAGNFRSLEKTFLSTLEVLANALDANEECSSSRPRPLTDMAVEVGREIGLDGATLKRLELGALLHDIGKIGIPSAILAKPGRLTAEERRVVEMHPELGERIIAPIERLQEVRAVVRNCHERVDGRGYPDGRTGEEIPIESRIILVCDAFDAMTSDRPYRRRLPLSEACRRLGRGAGTQFDARVVEAFLRLVGEGRPAFRVA